MRLVRGAPAQDGTGSTCASLQLFWPCAEGYRGFGGTSPPDAHWPHAHRSSAHRSSAHLPNAKRSNAYRNRVITWNVHPLRRFPVRATLAALLIMALGFAIGAAAGDWIWGSISMVVLFAATIRFWMRSTFAVDEMRVRAMFPLGSADVRWSDVQSARLAPRGMLLSMRAGTRPRTLAVDFAGLDDVKVMEIRAIVRENVGEVESAVPLVQEALRG